MQNKRENLKRLIVALVLVVFGGLIYLFGGFNSSLTLYEGFFAPRQKYKSLPRLEIPISDTNHIQKSYEHSFNLPLRRDYGLIVLIVSGGDAKGKGYPLSDPNTKIAGQIKIVSANGKVIKSLPIPTDYSVDIYPSDLLIINSQNLGGINKQATLIIDNLVIVKSDALKNKDASRLSMTHPIQKKPTFDNLRISFLFVGKKYISIELLEDCQSNIIKI